MRAAVLYYPRELRIEDRPDPASPGPHEVVLDVKMSGICGTDLHMYEGRFLRPGTPFPARVLGHDFAAVVRAVGSAVTDLAPGDRVTLDPTRNCGQCGACRAGAPNLCVKWAYMGMGIDGCLQDALVAERKYVHRLPDTVSDEEASVIEPIVVGLHVFDKRLADRRGDETVVVIGCGPIGVAALQIAKLRGHHHVIMVDIVPERLEFAARFGATELINPREGDAANRILESCGERPNIIIETAGTTTSAQLAFDSATWHGKIVFVALTLEPIPLRPLLSREVWATGARGGTEYYPDAIQLIADRKVEVRSMITHTYGLSELREAMELLLARPGEVFRLAIDHRR